MADFLYHLTVTPDHKLKVNNEVISGDPSIQPGDSEALLEWALIQITESRKTSDGAMTLQIEDQRQGGYGSQKVNLPPGVGVLIGSLRQKTGVDMSYISRQTGSARPTQPPITRPPSAAPMPQAKPERQQTDMTAPVLAPPPPLQGVPDVPATIPEQPARPRHARSATVEDNLREPAVEEMPERAVEPVQEAPALPPTHPEPALNPAWGGASPEVELAPYEDLNRIAQLPQGEVIEREEIASPPVSYHRDRPELGEDEIASAEQRKQKPKKSKPLIIALIVAVLAAGYFGAQYVKTQSVNSYVATCIDERTMVRQSSDSGCADGKEPYYRWWYTPSGSEVPAVNQTVSQDQGTRIRPEKANVHNGFAPEGGTYGGEKEAK